MLHQWDVTRGWTELNRRHFDDSSAGTALKCVRLSAPCYEQCTSDPSLHCAPSHSSHVAIEYPLPSSFPSFFRAQDLSAELRHSHHGVLTCTRSAPMVSTLESGCALPRLFTQYADFVGQCVRRKIDWATVGCVDKDEARQLRDDLWTLRDNFHETPELATDGNDEGLGEDEGV